MGCNGLTPDNSEGGKLGHFLFIDESGQDRQESPYEVLAGIAVQDSELWNLIQRTHVLEQDVFGMRVSEGKLELKGKKLLGTGGRP